MSVVAAAVIGSAAVGAYTSKRASDKAAEGTKQGLAQSGALAAQSRSDALNLYNQSRVAGQRGLTGAFNYYRQAAPAKYQPFIQGNVAAQKAISGGAVQANNAILGLPVDMGFAQPQQITPDLSAINNAQLPEMTGEYIPADAAMQLSGGLPVGSGMALGAVKNAMIGGRVLK